MTACVACETALRDYQENVSTDQTHGQTDPRQMCRYASQATQKPQHLKKKKTAQVIFGYYEFRRNLFSANALYTYIIIHGIFFYIGR